MAFTLEIVTPDGKAYSNTIDYVVLPTAEGEIGVLPGHIPLIAMLVPGELKVIRLGKEEFLAVDKGFVRIMGDVVAVLTEAAINIDEIHLSVIEEAEARARKALEEARLQKDFDPSELQRLEAAARFAFTQKVAKQKRHY